MDNSRKINEEKYDSLSSAKIYNPSEPTMFKEINEENKEKATTQLKSIITRVERLNEEMEALKYDIREVYSEAKSTGFDTKIIRKIIQLRKMDPNDRSEQEILLDTYIKELGGI